MRILLAVSGGMDSMYMAARAGDIFPGADVAVAHCNFGLRGEESDGDEEFVRSWCRWNGIPFFAKRFETAEYAASKGISIEMAARELRYAWFAELLSTEDFDAVAVAHNANDNAETLILNLLRGTGSRGLRGMGDREMPGGGLILRPILGTSREEISTWMSVNGVPHREDSTNATGNYKRNKIRNEVFPVFREINPSYLRTLGSDIRHFAQVDDIADDYFRSALPTVMVQEEAPSVSIPALLDLRHWEYVLFRIMEPYGFAESVILALSALLRSGGTISGKTFEAPAWKAVTTSSEIILSRRETSSGSPGLSIPGPGEYTFNGRKITVKCYDKPEGMELQRPEGWLIADADKLPFPFTLRGWNAGDWMIPLGLNGKKKLSDLFVDLKWGIPQKEKAIVLEHPDGREGHVGALLCERISESLKVSPSTRQIVEISLCQESRNSIDVFL